MGCKKLNYMPGVNFVWHTSLCHHKAHPRMSFMGHETLRPVHFMGRCNGKGGLMCRLNMQVCNKYAPIEGVSYVNVLGCGHCFCNYCAFAMKTCALCRAPVVGKFRLFI